MKSIFLSIALLMFTSPSFAYNDDSYNETALWESINGKCIGGRVVKDTQYVKYSCTRDEVRLDPKTKRLFKNKIQLRGDGIKDFKVSRNGKVFYRDQDGYLYDERGKLTNLGSKVSLYLVSTSGDLVYLDQRGDIFKNGQKLTSNDVIHKKFSTVRFLYGQNLPNVKNFTINPAVSRNGKAVYIDGPALGWKPLGNLYVDGIQVSSSSILVTDFKVSPIGEVMYRDLENRLYLNRTPISNGQTIVRNADNYQFNNLGQVAYLNESKELFYRGKIQPSDNRQVVSFYFNNNGDLFYKDTKGNRWKNGRVIKK
ncbi:MAG: hypothetical protein ACQ9MH_11060 [Nitrospinales bacterium]